MKHHLLFILVILYMATAHAEIYEHRDNAGNVSYSDVPSHNAKLIQPNWMNNLSQPDIKETPAIDTAVIQTPVTVKQMYTTFQFMSPSNEQTYQNQRDIPVELKVEPDLQEGDRVQLYVDNLLYGNPEPTTHLQLHQLDRGIHAIYAVIIDANKNIVKKTTTTTFYVHYANLGVKLSS